MPTPRDSGTRRNEPISVSVRLACLFALVVVLTLAILPFVALLAAMAAEPGVTDKPCPASAIPVAPGASIQDAVDRADDGEAFCLKNGIHRMQAVRPRQGQSFHGEGQTVLNGSRLITEFAREDRYWVASGQLQRGRKHGECSSKALACNLPEGLFIDDRPLTRVLSKQQVEAGHFHLNYGSGKLYFADDPTGRKVEATVATFAFKSSARGVLITNVTVEKYAHPAQSGAIDAGRAQDWKVENCELRLNNGTNGRVRLCDIHDNAQMGIGGVGRDVRIEQNRIWANNTRGFSFKWEAGGIKITNSVGVVFRGNHVHDNIGPGLWCDISCGNVVYEDNPVESNHDAGIFHEISFKAVIRNNVVRHNGLSERRWFWGADILVAASQGVEVHDNKLAVSADGCGIVLIDQSRAIQHVPRTRGRDRFVWGHLTLDWEGLLQRGLESNGRLVLH